MNLKLKKCSVSDLKPGDVYIFLDEETYGNFIYIALSKSNEVDGFIYLNGLASNNKIYTDEFIGNEKVYRYQ